MKRGLSLCAATWACFVAMLLLQVVSLFTEAARLNPEDADLQVTWLFAMGSP